MNQYFMKKILILFLIIFFLSPYVSSSRTDDLLIIGQKYEKTGDFELALQSYDQALTIDRSCDICHQHKISLLLMMDRSSDANVAREEQIRCLCNSGIYKTKDLWNSKINVGLAFLADRNYQEAEHVFRWLLDLCPKDRTVSEYLEIIKNRDNKELIREKVVNNPELFSDDIILKWLSEEIGDLLSIISKKKTSSGHNGDIRGGNSNQTGNYPSDKADNYGIHQSSYYDGQTSLQQNNYIGQFNNTYTGFYKSDTPDSKAENACSCHFQIKEERNVPTQAILDNNLGAEFFKNRNYATALSSFEEALVKAPDYGTALKNKGQVLVLFQDYDGGIATFSDVIQNHDDEDYCVYNNRGYAYYKKSLTENNRTVKKELLEKAIIDFDYGLKDIYSDFPILRNETVQNDVKIIEENRQEALRVYNLYKDDGEEIYLHTNYVHSSQSSIHPIVIIGIVIIIFSLMITIIYFKRRTKQEKDLGLNNNQQKNDRLWVFKIIRDEIIPIFYTRPGLVIICILILGSGFFYLMKDSDCHCIAKWGSYGGDYDQFDYPTGIAVNSSGYVYIVDGYWVNCFTPTGKFVGKWGGYVERDGVFHQPTGIVINSSDYVYVIEEQSMDICLFSICNPYPAQVQYFTSTGELIGKWGSKETGDGQFNYPSGIAVNSLGFVYVIDRGNRQVQYFTPSGEFIGKWGSIGTGDGRFNDPSGIAINPSGYIYVTDGNRIQYFTPSGEFIGKWGSKGTGDGQFNYIRGITVNSLGYVYVYDVPQEWNFQSFSIYYDRIQFFTPTGEFVGKCGNWKVTGNSWKGYALITTDWSDYLYKFDKACGQVQVFAPPFDFLSLKFSRS
jgi:tetratricopeptide (TPR) repeat protein